uniref:Fucosyltransferase n=1 Tax=Anolis carolinensis TaxID=28377 RepID=H9GDZ6_ANOCA|nr:PREDICTED: alpha-(1,3)-fucosyltransferase 6-like isoform X1 [Anolis carolinensis]|eukprot:XP_008123398.1 PREDICTED: alpha-(1,3)-fucosyltransferase 6-like isoform X1 [Anolis carolinensis]
MGSSGQAPGLTCWKVLTFLILQLSFSAIFFAYVRIHGKANQEVPEFDMVSQTRCPPVSQTPCPPAGQPQRSTVGERSSNLITILLWTWPFGRPFLIQKCSQLLGLPDCDFTTNRSRYQEADAVIVHHRDVCWSAGKLPQLPRPPSQLWIWFNLESPSASPNLHFMDHHFNLTMSYRRDSDIFTPYGWMEVLPRPGNVTVPPKSKLVAWVLSNWKPGSRRVQYYNELKKHLQVDVYGRGHLPLRREDHLSTLSQYKFYLAFENTVHEDYITEKVWRNSFVTWAVPVVLGPPRKSYERHMPPESFIHVDDFPSAQDLATFLQELDRNATRYQSYFRWRERLKPVGETCWAMHFCKACWALQKKPVQYQTIPELSKWFK